MFNDDRTTVGELAAVLTAGRPATPEDALVLLDGYGGQARQLWVDGRVALVCTGAAELEATDDLIVAVDGRLDNRAELAALLGADAGASLAQLITECWGRFGAACVDRLIGDIAGVVVHRRSLTISVFRDLCGGRPLHVARGADEWRVASEWQPLVGREPNCRRPNPEWFVAGLVGHSLDPRATPYTGAEVVLPGHVASPSSAGWTQKRVATWDVPVLRDRRPGVYAEEFRALFDEAVRARIPAGADGIGVTLSGGLDSTSVLAAAHELRAEVDRTAFCLPFTDPTADERSVQTYMATRCESRLRWVDIAGLRPFGPHGPEALFERCGAPPLVINWFYGDALAEAAASAGIHRVLDGEDGDGSVGGSHAYLADLIVTGRWLRWLDEVNAMRRLGAVAGREMLRESLMLAVPPPLRRAYVTRAGDSYAPAVLAPGLAGVLNVEGRLHRGFMNRTWAPGKVFALAQREVGSTEHVTPKYTAISEPWRRRGVELAHPWADRRLMSFCMGLPYVHVRTKALPKIVLREAMRDRLPDFLLAHNGKAALSEVIDAAVQGSESETVTNGLALAQTQDEWFSPAGVVELQKDVEAGKSFAMASRVAMFARWLRWCDVS